jgi:2-desacetyl-2-hydroxyethyl bacteriochlorophyllide A dehydrogenase
VVCGPDPGCGECRACLVGRPSVCLERPPTDHLSFRGAFAQYVLAPADQLVAVPEHLPSRAAALTEPTAVALHAVTLSKVTPDDRVLVTGAGPVGLLVTAVLHAQGVRDITVSEPAAARRERALAVGAARAVTPDSLPTPTMGLPVPEPYTVVFECSGNASAGEAAIDQLDFAGVCVLVGTGHDFPRLNHNRVIILENTIIGSYNYDAGGFAPALELLASGAMPLDALIEPVDVFLDELLPVMQRCAAGELPGKVMVRPERRPEVAQS